MKKIKLVDIHLVLQQTRKQDSEPPRETSVPLRKPVVVAKVAAVKRVKSVE